MDDFNDNEISRLLRLKRYEQPPPGYFEDFLHEFHRRQRDELLRQPLWQIAWQRANDFMLRLDIGRIASLPAAAAAVLVCVAVISLKLYQTPPETTASISNFRAPIAAESNWSLATEAAPNPLAPATRVAATPVRPVFNPNLSTRRKETPPRYVLDSMPVSYESTLRF